jgi:hypothetical protein
MFYNVHEQVNKLHIIFPLYAKFLFPTCLSFKLLLLHDVRLQPINSTVTLLFTLISYHHSRELCNWGLLLCVILPFGASVQHTFVLSQTM